MKYFQSQEILTTNPPPSVVKFSTTSGFALQGITACFLPATGTSLGSIALKGHGGSFPAISRTPTYLSRALTYSSRGPT